MSWTISSSEGTTGISSSVHVVMDTLIEARAHNLESMSVEILERAIGSTSEILVNVRREQMEDASPCASWKVRDLVNHIVGGAYWFAVTVDSGVAPPSDRDAGAPEITEENMMAAYAEGARRVIAAFSAPGAKDKTLKLPFGEMPASAFVMLAAGDQFQHGWDLAKATGQRTELDPEIAEQLLVFAHGALPESFRGDDGKAPFGPRVDIPTTASAPDRLAAFMGRNP